MKSTLIIGQIRDYRDKFLTRASKDIDYKLEIRVLFKELKETMAEPPHPLIDIRPDKNNDSSTSTPGHEDLRGPPYICGTCKKQFSLKSNLRQHMNVHSKPFSCGVCSKRFSLRGHCKVHEWSHHKMQKVEKPFKCHCGNAYSHQGNLTRHQRIHTGKNLHPCQYCGRSFVTQQCLENHKRTHTGERLKCFLCSKSFSTQGQLTTHLRWHTGEKPYNCKSCEKCFTRKSNLDYHTLTNHKS